MFGQGDRVEVEPGAKTTPGPGHDNHPHRVVVGSGFEGGGYLVGKAVVYGVQLFRAVKSDGADPFVRRFDQYMAKFLRHTR